MQSTRRHFLTSAALFGAALCASRALVACAFDAAKKPEDAVLQSENGLVTCEPAVISANHAAPREHRLVVPSTDVAEGVEKTYSIKGKSGHDHSVTITAEQFAALAARVSLVSVSTAAGTGASAHSHTVTVSCASDADASTVADASTASTCKNGARASSISSNHEHALVVPAADVSAGLQKTYSIMGTASHDHTVTITPMQFTELASGASIVTVSAVDGTRHRHSVTVSCASV